MDGMFEESAAQTARIKKLAESIVCNEARIGELDKQVAAEREALAAVMRQAGIDSVKLDSGLAPKLETKNRISKRKEAANETVFAWLEANGLGDIVRPAVHPQTLAATLEEFAAEGNAIPEELFHCFEQDSIRFNGRSHFLATRK
ncbi:MAG: hypothetical protein IH624_02600 [Phycisphaerae bacterium]|nr:hypothetical protein [Phycisphaerae bacterium]